MKKIDTSRRTDMAEVMDDFDLSGKELERTLKDLDNINKWLGGNQITLNGVKKLLRKVPKNEKIIIADVGCGNGQILREIAQWGRKNNRNLELIGIDANTHAMEIAEKMSTSYPELRFSALNIFEQGFREQQFDIVLCTLTLHHFTDTEIVEILKSFYRQVRRGIVVNDLHRSKYAYQLFQAFCKVFINNEIARKDGLISILRGFKKQDLQKFAARLPSKKHKISWKWAFRFQWLIEKE